MSALIDLAAMGKLAAPYKLRITVDVDEEESIAPSIVLLELTESAPGYRRYVVQKATLEMLEVSAVPADKLVEHLVGILKQEMEATA